MKHDTTMRDGIQAALKALTVMLRQATTNADRAHQYICRNEQGMAVGAIVPVEDALNGALTLYHAVLAGIPIRRCESTSKRSHSVEKGRRSHPAGRDLLGFASVGH